MLDSLSLTHELEGGELLPTNGANEVYDCMMESCISADKQNGHPIPLVERIVKRLIGTQQNRLANLDEESIQSLKNQVQGFVHTNSPILFTTSSGSRKYRAETMDINKPDVAELCSLAMLFAIHKAVSQVYSPGARFQIIQEDSGGKFLNQGNERVPEEFMDIYALQLETLVSTIACLKGVIVPVRESSLLQKKGVTSQQEFDSSAREYYFLFLQYLLESDKLLESEWGKLESFQNLKDAGWLGLIPIEMREYYYQRVASIYRANRALEKCSGLARLFAAVLLRKKHNITADIDAIAPEGQTADPIRFSFAAPTPGMPTKGGRIFLRGVPKKYCGNGIPYWAGHGVVLKKEDMRHEYYPAIRNRCQTLSPEKTIVPGKMTLQSDGSSYQMSADVVR